MIRAVCCLALVCLFAVPAFAEKAANFRLTDSNSASHELYRLADSAAVVLISYGIDCPVAKQQAPEWKELAAALQEKGVPILAIDPESSDTREAVREAAAAAGLEFPILMDESQGVSKALGYSRLAEAMVLDPKNDWAVAYRGSAAKAPVAAAVEAVLAKADVPEQPAATGCRIAYDTHAISYSKDVAPILETRCVSCHRKDGIGPFAMSSLNKVRGWSDMIRETLLTQRMPPWHADPHFGTYSNDIGLTAREKATLLAWVEAGAPGEDGAEDPLAVAAAKREEDWALGTPDAVVSLPEPESLPAEGVVQYRYRFVPSGFTEDKWVRGLEVKAGNPKVVHHALIFVVYPKEYRHLQPNARGGLGGYFGAFLPGAIIKPYPENTAQWVPAGSTFVFQMHYTVTGKEETDQTRMGLYFAPEPPAQEYRVEAANTTDFEIPAEAADYGATAEYTFKQPATIWALSPHMHYRGSRFRFDVRQPDGPVTTALNVPHYEFDWQPLYLLKNPISVAANATVFCDGGFDNSRFNPKNPNPKESVTFGEQSFEEMFIGYVGYSVPRDDSARVPLKPEQMANMGMGQPITEASLVGTKWRLGGRMVIEFHEDGNLIFNQYIPARWRVERGTVTIENPLQPLELGMVGDEMFFSTRALRYLRTGDEPVEDWESSNSNRRAGSSMLMQRMSHFKQTKS